MTATIIPFDPSRRPRVGRRPTAEPGAITSNPAALAAYCAQIDAAWERGFRGPGLIDLRAYVRRLPLLVQCAWRVHEGREARTPLLFTLSSSPVRAVIASAGQKVVLVFSRAGLLVAAGDLISSPSHPVSWGERWTRIDWADDVTKRDWY